MPTASNVLLMEDSFYYLYFLYNLCNMLTCDHLLYDFFLRFSEHNVLDSQVLLWWFMIIILLDTLCTKQSQVSCLLCESNTRTHLK